VPPVKLYTVDLALAEAPRYYQHCDILQLQQPPSETLEPVLWLDADGLMLINPAVRQPLRLTSQMLERRLQGGSLLARACGMDGSGATVLDAFAGFGFDALTLVHLGFEVTALEYHPLVWLMLVDFTERVGAAIDSRCEDSLAMLSAGAQSWDIVYLDPMFPARRKRALPNLALQHLQQLNIREAADQAVDVEDCLAMALSCATRRVVLKRRPKDPVLGKPNHQFKGQAVRFDVYV
jgi:16S rRNA (guanine1516-N2)-methyltransferase